MSEAEPAIANKSATSAAGNSSSNPSKKSSEAALAEIDNRLKSLMDRLSSQQKLLKPAEKPSSEMQHFLSSTSSSQQNNASSMASSASTSALLESSSSAITSPTTVTSPPAAALLRSPPAATSNTSQNSRFMQGAMPKAYRSMSSEKPDKSFEEVESITVPELPDTSAKDVDAKIITSGSSDFETEEEEKAKSDAGAPEAVKALPNESSSFGDEFESCNEGEESATNVEAVNPSLLLISNGEIDIDAKNANESSIFATPDLDQPPEAPSHPPPPLATSSPYTSMEQQIDFIDRYPMQKKLFCLERALGNST